MKAPMKTIVTIFVLLASASAHAHKPHAFVCVSDQRSGGGPLAGFLMETRDYKSNLWIINSARVNEKTKTLSIRRDDWWCGGSVSPQDTVPAQYIFSMLCLDPKHNEETTDGFYYVGTARETRLTQRREDKNGKVLGEKRLVAPVRESCRSLEGEEVNEVKAYFQRIVDEGKEEK